MGQDVEIQLIVGLGNPGEGYQGSRHNIGFAVVEALAERYSAGRWRVESTHREVVVEIGGRFVVLACPLTFMNRSGQAVSALIGKSDFAPSEVLVVVDDIDLCLGRMRLRRRGGAGTHNGLKSISEAVGDDFPRLRVGVGGADGGTDLAEYVLSPFPDDEMPKVQKVLDQAVNAVTAAVSEGVGHAMNRFNGVVVDISVDQASPDRRVWELGTLRPIPSAPWIPIDDIIVVECPRPLGRGPKYWSDWFRWWMGPQRIRLDGVGSAVWRRIDGKTPLAEIADSLAEEMPDDRQHLVARIDLFVRTLASQGLLRLE